MHKKSFTVHPVYSDASYKQRENIRTQKNISHTFHSLIGSYFLSIYRGFSPNATFWTWKKFALAKNRISKIFILCTQ